MIKICFPNKYRSGAFDEFKITKLNLHRILDCSKNYFKKGDKTLTSLSLKDSTTASLAARPAQFSVVFPKNSTPKTKLNNLYTQILFLSGGLMPPLKG